MWDMVVEVEKCPNSPFVGAHCHGTIFELLWWDKVHDCGIIDRTAELANSLSKKDLGHSVAACWHL
uniref:Uncharacterized protein n=1 Tax=Arundo donax TaxID=35708 RepID=A0A0A9D5W1_ARUDO